MEKLKSINFINNCYGERTMDILKNDEGSIEFHEMCNEKAEGEKIPSKVVNWITVKWCAENGKLKPEDINEYEGQTVTDDDGIHEITEVKKINNAKETTTITKPTKTPKKVTDSYQGFTAKYNGKSKKIKTSIVTVITDNGAKCKIKDEEGNIATVSKTALKK
jgi:hypothetical protein